VAHFSVDGVAQFSSVVDREGQIEENNYDRFTKLIYITDGSLMNWIMAGRAHEFGIIVIDEAHERNVNIDVILMLLKRELVKYPHLKLIITSATIDPQEFVDFYGEFTSVGVCDFSAAREEYQYERTFASNAPREPREFLRGVADACIDVFRNPAKHPSGEAAIGHLLAFLPGQREIKDVQKKLEGQLSGDEVKVVPLFRGAPEENFDDARNNNDSLRRIYLGTNIAETSLTIANLDYVIETGSIYTNRWDPVLQRESTDLDWHSKAGCRQRWGRVGRGRLGWVRCLYSESQFEHLPEYTTIGVLKENLEEVLLRLSLAGLTELTDESLWLQKPDPRELSRCLRTYQSRSLTKTLDDKYDVVTKYGESIYDVARELARLIGEIKDRSYDSGLDLSVFLLLCERFGCLIEGVAAISIFPWIERSLYQRYDKRLDEIKSGVFLWDAKWRDEKKTETRLVHYWIFQKCRDDLDLALLLFGIVEKNPHITISQADWVDRCGIDLDALRDPETGILPLRNALLDYFQDHASDRNRQVVNYEKTGLVRLLMSVAWQDKIITRPSNRGAIVERKIDQQIGLLSPFSTLINRDWTTALPILNDSSDWFVPSLNYVTPEKKPDGRGEFVPTRSFTTACAAIPFAGDLPTPEDTIGIMSFKQSQAENPLLQPLDVTFENPWPPGEIRVTPSAATGAVTMDFVDKLPIDPHNSKNQLVIGNDKHNSVTAAPYGDAAALGAGEAKATGLPLTAAIVGTPTSGLKFSFAPQMIELLKSIDISIWYEGVIRRFLPFKTGTKILVSCEIPNEPHTLEFLINPNSLAGHGETLDIGLPLKFKLTRRNQDGWYRLNDSEQQLIENSKALVDALGSEGFTVTSQNNRTYLRRKETLKIDEATFLSDQKSNLRSLAMSYLAIRHRLNIDEDTIETQSMEKIKKSLCKEVAASSNPASAMQNTLRERNYAGRLPRDFINRCRSFRSDLYDLQQQARENERLKDKVDYLRREPLQRAYTNLGKNLDQVQTAKSETFRTKATGWMMQSRAKVYKLEHDIDEYESQIQAPKNLTANQLYKKIYSSTGIDSRRYFQHYYLMNSEDHFLTFRFGKIILARNHQRHGLIKAFPVITTKGNTFVDGSGGRTASVGDILLLSFFPDRIFLTQSEIRIKLNDLKDGDSRLNDLLQFKVIKLNKEFIEIEQLNGDLDKLVKPIRLVVADSTV
jgi:hypothetical protein